MPDTEVNDGVAPNEDIENISLTVTMVANKFPYTIPCAKDEMAWKLICLIKRHPHVLEVEHIRVLMKTLWFDVFFKECVMQDTYCIKHTYEEIANMLLQCCPNAQPRQHVTLCENSLGECVVFVPCKALQHVAKEWGSPNGPSESTKRRIMSVSYTHLTLPTTPYV